MMKKLRSDEANRFEERYAELGRKIKDEAEIAATTQKPKMTESLTMSKQSEGVIDAEVAASLHWNEDANAAAAGTEQAESRLVAEATATRNRGEDTRRSSSIQRKSKENRSFAEVARK